mgnify:FL=1
MNMKMQLMDDTICAICTPIGPGSVAVIRISGSNSYEIVKKIFVAKNEKDFANLEPRKTYLGDIKFDGRFIDEVICIFFSSPHSLTGEDVKVKKPKAVKDDTIDKITGIREPWGEQKKR